MVSVMKRKLLIIESVRNIRRQMSSFVSIVVIAMLAVTVFLGISYAAEAIYLHISRYYAQQSFQDLQVISPLLLTEEDAAAIRSLDGVADAEGGVQTDAWFRSPNKGGADKLVVLSMPKRIAMPELMEGRFPQTAEECAVELEFAEKNGLRIGESIRLEGKASPVPELLTRSEYTITGFFHHPDHITNDFAWTYYVIMRDEAFDADSLDDNYTRIRVTLTDLPENLFSESYWKKVDPIRAAVEALGEERAPMRLESVRRDIGEEIADAETELAGAEADFEDAKEKLADAEVQLRDAETQLADAESTISDAERELSDQEAEFAEMEEQANGAEFLLKDARRQLEEARAELEEKRAELEEKKGELEEKKAELEEKRTELEDAGVRIENARSELEDAKKQLEELGSADWTVMSNIADAGYRYSEQCVNNLSSISSSFSVIFVLVAILVIYSSIGRMVDEQSSRIGTTKAMGMFGKEIMWKYFFYGNLGTMLGVVFGILTGYFVLQPVLLKMYGGYFNITPVPRGFLLLSTLLVFIGGAILSVLAVLFACRQLLHISAISLMKGEVRSARRRQSSRQAGSLYSRLIVLNMISDPKRVLVTIVSIAGCCILLMIGFTMKFAQDNVTDAQYGHVQLFDARLQFEPEREGAEEALASVLDGYRMEYREVSEEKWFIEGEKDKDTCIVIVPETDGLAGWYELRDARTKSLLELPEHGILISKRMHEIHHYEVGGTMTLYNDRMTAYDAEIAGIVNNYSEYLVFMSRSAYLEVFGHTPDENCYYIKSDGKDLSELRSDAEKTDGFLQLKETTEQKEMIRRTSESLNVLIIVMIISAGLMACFILTNLTSSYMIHKQRELTIMRINGFSTKECLKYAAAELAATTGLGILAGVPAGAGLGYLIIRKTEGNWIQLVRSVDLRSVVFSILMTLVFSFLINSFALRRVRNLKLSDVG